VQQEQPGLPARGVCRRPTAGSRVERPLEQFARLLASSSEWPGGRAANERAAPGESSPGRASPFARFHRSVIAMVRAPFVWPAGPRAWHLRARHLARRNRRVCVAVNVSPAWRRPRPFDARAFRRPACAEANRDPERARRELDLPRPWSPDRFLPPNRGPPAASSAGAEGGPRGMLSLYRIWRGPVPRSASFVTRGPWRNAGPSSATKPIFHLAVGPPAPGPGEAPTASKRGGDPTRVISPPMVAGAADRLPPSGPGGPAEQFPCTRGARRVARLAIRHNHSVVEQAAAMR